MKKIPLPGEDTKTAWRESAKDRLFHFTFPGIKIKGALIHANRIVKEMRANHDLGILETMILGHAYLGALLTTTTLKGNERLALKVDCSGPVKGFDVEANTYGEVRGFLKNSSIPIDKPLENFDMSSFFGAGFISLTRYLENSKSPYTGQVILKYGSIARDLAYYFLTSEQIPSAFHLSIDFDREGNITGAGGLMLQVLPGADENTVAELEEQIARMPSLGKVFSGETTGEIFLTDYFKEYKINILFQKRAAFMCHCSNETVQKVLFLLPHSDFDDIKQNGPFPLEVKCHFCDTAYHFTEDDLEGLKQERNRRN